MFFRCRQLIETTCTDGCGYRASHAAQLTLNCQEPPVAVNGLLTATGGSCVFWRGGNGQPHADGAADLTRGGGPYAGRRIGLASRLPAFAQ
jgi:hypothetical protein